MLNLGILYRNVLPNGTEIWEFDIVEFDSLFLSLLPALLHPAALNFSKETCVLYECPEFGIRKSEQGSSVYDYYSAYARPARKFLPLNHFIAYKLIISDYSFVWWPVLAKTNVSCIPKVGVFQLHRERKNYENAELLCENEGGTLADIATDLHTTHLSSLMGTLNVSLAYVGLKQWNETQDEYLTSKGKKISGAYIQDRINTYVGPGTKAESVNTGCKLIQPRQSCRLSIHP